MRWGPINPFWMRSFFGIGPFALAVVFVACSDPMPPPGGSGGAGAGGFGSGGLGSGGLGSGGLGSGGLGSGGLASGGAGVGGQGSGGLGIGGTGTGGAAGLKCNDPVNLPRTYAAVLECVIEPGCQSSICHGGEVPLLLIDTWENFPRREDHSPYDTLAETLLNYTVEHCAGSPLVDPGNPENSAIVKALGRQCDDPEWGMPDGCSTTPCVPQEYIDFIAGWIAAGATM